MNSIPSQHGVSDLTVSLGLVGDVTIEAVAQSADTLHRLLVALADEVGSTVKIEWIPENLQIGSLHSTYRARPIGNTTVAEAEQVVQHYCQLGEQLERNEKLVNGDAVAAAVSRLLKQARTYADELVLGSAARDAIIDLKSVQAVRRDVKQQSIGSVTGRVQTVSVRSSLQFVLYQEWTDHAIRCYASDDHVEALRMVWGCRSRVYGTLTRSEGSGHIVSIRDISTIEALPEEPEQRFEDARGSIEWLPEHPSPERFVRELRDGE